MTARQRVRNALTGVPSDHPAFTWGFGPNRGAADQLRRDLALRGLDWDQLREACEDVVWVHPQYTGPAMPQGQAVYMAIWGIGTRRVDYGRGVYDDEMSHHPLQGIDDPCALDDYPWPSPDHFDYEATARQRRERDPQQQRAVRLTGGNPFEIYTWMTGMEDAFMHLATDPGLVEVGLSHICRFYKASLARQVEAMGGDVDIVQIADDLGSQHGPLISREHYRSIIQPYHRQLIEHIRSLLPEVTVAYHTDGSVFDLIPDLIEIGVDVLEAVQVECADMEPAKLAKAFGETLMYQGGISVQQLLPHATPAQVRAECRKLIETLGANGGYIAAPSHAIQVGTPAENVLAMLEEVLGAERYAEALATARL